MFERFQTLCAKVPQDKAMHFISLQVLALALLAGLPKHPLSILTTAILCAAVATWNEIHQMGDPHHHAEVWDAVAGVLGGVPLYLLYWARVLH